MNTTACLLVAGLAAIDGVTFAAQAGGTVVCTSVGLDPQRSWRFEPRGETWRVIHWRGRNEQQGEWAHARDPSGRGRASPVRPVDGPPGPSGLAVGPVRIELVDQSFVLVVVEHLVQLVPRLHLVDEAPLRSLATDRCVNALCGLVHRSER